MCLHKHHILGSCLGVPRAAVLNKLFVLVRRSQHSRIQLVLSKAHKIRKFAAVCSAASIFLPSMQLARERLVWEAADGRLCTNTGFPLHRTSPPQLCACKHTIGPRVSPREQTTPMKESILRGYFSQENKNSNIKLCKPSSFRKLKCLQSLLNLHRIWTLAQAITML